MSGSAFTCRACGSADITVLLDMGRQPLANAFVRDEADDGDGFREQLTLVMCGSCSMVQLREEVPPEDMFRNYLWVTSTSAAAGAHAKWLSAKLAAMSPGPDRFLVEVASNDGFFLQHYRDAGFRILGVDPSNLALEADARGLPSVREFFGLDAARRIRDAHGPADVIVARNVLGHVNKPRDLAAGIRHLLAPGGRFVLEVPYAMMLRNDLQYDTVFHEHVSYPSVHAVVRLMADVGLKIRDITFVDMNGGSILCEIVEEAAPVDRGDRAVLDLERLVGLDTPRGWQRFADDVKRQRVELVALLDGLRTAGRRVVAYGAAAKCMTMLNYCGIDTRLVSAIGDANPRKQGLLCPGVRIPVVSPEALLGMQPEYILIGAWNFRDEIIGQFRARGYDGAFIVPLPRPEIVRH
jgi:SAM-dependent methyltransferase